MIKAIFLCLLVICCASIDIQNEQYTLQDQFKNLFDALNPSELPQLFYLYQTYQYLPQSKPIMDKKQICQKLEEYSNQQVNSFVYYSFLKQLDCGIQLNNTLEKGLKNSLEASTLNDVYESALLLNNYNKLDKSLKAKLCDHILNFLDVSGAAKNQKRQQENSYENSHKVYEIIDICYQDAQIQNKMQNTVEISINNLLLNSQQINKKNRAIFEGNSYLATTSNIVLQLYKINQKKKNLEFSKVFTQFLEFIQNNGAKTLDEKYSYYKLFSYLIDFPIINFENDRLINKSTNKVKLQLNNLFGQNLQQTKNITGSLSYMKNQMETKIEYVFKNQESQIDTNELKVGSFDSFVIYDHTYPTQIRFQVMFKASITNIKFDITESKNDPEYYQKMVNPNQMYQGKLEAGGRNFIHLKFKIDFENQENHNIQLVGILLKHPKFRSATNIVLAQQDKSNLVYKVIMDLGNPDVVLPYDDQYELEVILDDIYLIQSFRKVFANIKLSFLKPRAIPPPQDTDSFTKEIIQFTQAAPHQPPNSMITIMFLAGCFYIFFCYLTYLQSLDINLDKMKHNSSKHYGFTVVLILYVCILWLFWVKINLIQAMILFSILMIPTLYLGNQSLVDLQGQNQLKQKQE